MNELSIDSMVGKTITKIDAKKGCNQAVFYTADKIKYTMYHDQDCCESVWLEDIVGDLEDIIGSPILRATEDSNVDRPPVENSNESYTWTFYNIATEKGHVTLRWFGESNGYYGEEVEISGVVIQ